jgi:hypothetical protein
VASITAMTTLKTAAANDFIDSDPPSIYTPDALTV